MLSNSRGEDVRVIGLVHWQVVEPVSVGRVGGSGWLNYLSCCNGGLGHLGSCYLSVSPHFICEQVYSIWNWNPSLSDILLHQSSSISKR